jgi:hypothetical protein
LDITHNSIHDEGLTAVERAITAQIPSPSKGAYGLIKIGYEQVGVTPNEMTIEKLRRQTALHSRLIRSDDKINVDESLHPSHLKDIASVYRTNGKYKEDNHEKVIEMNSSLPVLLT